METSEFQNLKPGCLLSIKDDGAWILVYSDLDEDPYGGWMSGKPIFLFLEYNRKGNYIKALQGKSIVIIDKLGMKYLCKVS